MGTLGFQPCLVETPHVRPGFRGWWPGKEKTCDRLPHPAESPYYRTVVEPSTRLNDTEVRAKETMAKAKSERAEELAALYEISSAILSTLDVDAVLQRVCDSAGRLLNAGGAMITEYREEAGEFFLQTCSGTFRPALHYTFPAEKSLSARALTHGEAVIDNDVLTGPASDIAASLPVPIERAIIALLNGREGVLGTLVCVAEKDRDPFTEADAQLISAFATQAIALINDMHL